MKDQHQYEIDQCALYPDMDRYSKFRRIPSDLVSEPSLVAWIVHGGILEEIPQDLRTERVLWAAARHDDTAYGLIGADQVSDHQGLSLEALMRGKTTFGKIPWDHKDEDFLIEMTRESIKPIAGIGLMNAYSHLITSKVAEAICSRSISHAYGFWVAGGDDARALITDDCLRRAFHRHCDDYAELDRLGMRNLLVEQLATGFWPDEKGVDIRTGQDSILVKPSDPMAALSSIEISKKYGHQILYTCWILSRPVEEVIESLQVKKVGMDKIFELYPEAELRKHMRAFRSLRGRLLEQDLGM